jgi:hypothetical protein
MANARRNTIDWDDPEQRLELIQRVGPARYNQLLQAHQRASVIEVCNGRSIRLVRSERFGPIYWVDGLDAGSPTLEGARQMAASARAGGEHD